MPDFANTLEHISKNGVKDFYEGDYAAQVVKDCKEKGGYLTMEDFKDYKVIERDPLGINYNGNKFITNPPPSSGGALIAFSLELLEKTSVVYFLVNAMLTIPKTR